MYSLKKTKTSPPKEQNKANKTQIKKTKTQYILFCLNSSIILQGTPERIWLQYLSGVIF